MVAEALAAIRLLAAHLTLDQHAPGAVQHDDALTKYGLESLSRSRHHPLPPTGSGSARMSARGLFRRLVTRSPSCLQSSPGFPIRLAAAAVGHAAAPPIVSGGRPADRRALQRHVRHRS